MIVLRAIEEMMAEIPEELMTGRSLGDHRAGNGEFFNLIPHVMITMVFVMTS